MRIIGVDPGLNITGIGVIEVDGDQCRWLFHGTVRTKTSMPLVERLLRLRDGVRDAAAEWRADTGAVEAGYVGEHARSALALGQARAAAIVGLGDAGVDVAEYAPRLVKQAVAGFGGSSKGQVGEMVRVQLGLESAPTPSDAADALAVAIAHWHGLRFAALPRA
jgi:crossover junction endodeoxyribonuclease RuvC